MDVIKRASAGPKYIYVPSRIPPQLAQPSYDGIVEVCLACYDADFARPSCLCCGWQSPTKRETKETVDDLPPPHERLPREQTTCSGGMKHG